MRRGFKSLTAFIIVLNVAACAPAPEPLPPPPPPIVIAPPPPPPVMPLPPGGAATTMQIPPVGVDGVRVTPNRGLTRDEYIWHFRAALNVAALNCQGPAWSQLAPQYNKFILAHKVQLSKSSKAVDREYVSRYPGQNGLRMRDTRMTDLYNYFALPPVKSEYCDVALRKVGEGLLLPTTALADYAIGGLAELDGIYIRFFDAYAQYERDLAAWNMLYAPRPVFVPLQPQPGATQQPTLVPQPSVAPPPSVAQQPALVPEPSVAPPPSVSQQPALVPQPSVAPPPSVSQQPALVPEPSVVPPPSVSQQPALVPEPSVVPQPSVSQQPANTIPPLKPLNL